MYGAVCRPATRVPLEYFTARPNTYAEGISFDITLSTHTESKTRWRTQQMIATSAVQ